MRRAIALTIVAMALVASTASAQLDLTWRNCVLAAPGEPVPTQDDTMNCAVPEEHRLFASFKAPRVLPEFIAMDISLDLQSQSPGPLAPFWHFESGGCNSGGIVLRADKSSSGGCSLLASPWGDSAEDTAFVGITVYVPDHNGLGRGRILMAITRSSENPFPLETGINYYAFELRIRTDPLGDCVGCAQTVSIVQEQLYPLDHVGLTLYDRLGLIVVVNGPDKSGRTFVTLTGETPTPTLNHTWGSIKSQYR